MKRMVVFVLISVGLFLISGCAVEKAKMENNSNEEYQLGCYGEMNQEDCERSGGIWHPPGTVCMAMSCPKAKPPYCDCPEKNIIYANKENKVSSGDILVINVPELNPKRGIRIYTNALERKGYGWHDYDLEPIPLDLLPSM